MEYKYFQDKLKLTVYISVEIMNNIYTQAKLFSPNEFGGVLVGNYSTCGKIAFVKHTLQPNLNNKSRTIFKRTVNEINIELSRLYENSGGKLYYLGEWHSHPYSSSQYSQLDLKSIEEIAKEKTVKIDSPLMLIIAFGDNYQNETLYIMHKNVLYTFDKHDNRNINR